MCMWLVLTPGREPEAGLASESEVSARFEAMPASLRDALMPFQREVRDVVPGDGYPCDASKLSMLWMLSAA